MKYRIAMWASAGFLVAGCWALYALASAPPAFTSADPLLALVRLTCPIALLSSLVRLTCPIALLSFYPIRLYWVLLANAAAYALVGLIIETLRQRLNHAR